MYFIANSSKGVSSVFLARWIGVSQKTAWKIGHAIRLMMEPGCAQQKLLTGIVELDEKYLGEKPRYQTGIVHKRGKALINSECSLPPSEAVQFGPFPLKATE